MRSDRSYERRGHRSEKDYDRSRSSRRNDDRIYDDSRHYEHSRSYDRDRRGSPDRRSRHSRDRERSYSSRNNDSSRRTTSIRHRSHSRDRRDDSYRDYDEPSFQKTPTHVLIMRGLHPNTTEETIADRVKVFGPVDEVRLIKNKHTGESRCFAFIDFFTVEDATQFLEASNRSLEIDGQVTTLDYSSVKPTPVSDNKRQDWICPHCNYKNFARRVTCLNCSREKPDDAILCPSDKLQSNVLLVRGLHPNTSRETLVSVFAQFQRQLQDVRLIKDKNTGLSRGFCFVEFYSVPDAAYVLHTAGSQLYIDQQPVVLSFADASPGTGRRRSNWDEDRTENYGNSEDMPFTDTSADTTMDSESFKPTHENSSSNQQLLPPNPPPNADWKFDEQSGYYYDLNSTYYYDYNSGFYFDPTSQNYYQYDHELLTFVLPGDSQNSSDGGGPRTGMVPSSLNIGSKSESDVGHPTTKTTTTTTRTQPGTTIASTTAAATKKKKKVTTVLSAPTTVPTLLPEQEKKIKQKKPPVVTVSPAVPSKVAKDINRWAQKNQELKENVTDEKASPPPPKAPEDTSTDLPTLLLTHLRLLPY